MRARLLATIALVIGVPAAAGEARLYEESRGGAGTVVRVYSEGGETYRTTIETPGKPAVAVPPQPSLPPPRLHWISPDLFRIDFGSELGADVTSLFYSVRRNAVDGPYEFVKAVDPVTERILCTGADVVVQRLFGGGGKVLVKRRDMNRAGLKWFVVSSRSRFDGDRLYLEYMLEPSGRGEARWVTRVVRLPPRSRGRTSAPGPRRSAGPG